MVMKPVDTAIRMVVGPCINDSDFKSIVETIAYDATGMDISLVVEKTDDTISTTAITLTSSGVNDWVHVDGGYYSIEITAAQNIEEGIAYLRGVCDDILPFESPHYNIVTTNIYNSWIKGTAKLEIDMLQINGFSSPVNRLEDFVVNGYNSTSHKVAGVELVDVTTTNTDMITDIISITPLIPNSIDLANTVWIRVGLGVMNALGNLPTTAEITPGTITIRRKAFGGTSWTTITNAASCQEVDGLIYHESVFSSSNGYAAGDSIQILFEGQSVTVDGILHEITDGAGLRFQTYIREIMRGTDSANTTIPDAAGIAAGLHTTTDGLVTTVDGVVDSILVDTNELQTNQGDWATAVGFSTHSASDIWSSVTRSLTDKAGFSLSTAGIKAIWDQLTSVLTTVGSLGKLLVDNINTTISSRSPANEYDTEMARLDVAISTRNAIVPNTVIPDAAGVAPTAVEIRQEMDLNSTKMAPSQVLNDYKATGFNTVIPDAAGTAPTVSEIRTEMDNNSTRLSAIDSNIDTLIDEIGGKWEIVSNQMIFYKSDNTTEIMRFNLFDASGNPTMTNVVSRERV